MIAALQAVLVLSGVAALLLAAVVRAALPGHLLAPVGRAWQWWLIYRPLWLPAKPSGDCAFCTAFWLPGLPLAAAAFFTPAGWYALLLPPVFAFLFEFFIARLCSPSPR